MQNKSKRIHLTEAEIKKILTFLEQEEKAIEKIPITSVNFFQKPNLFKANTALRVKMLKALLSIRCGGK